jgi:hypothetical protein
MGKPTGNPSAARTLAQWPWIWYHSGIMKLDERMLPYAEEMKTCGYCAEGEYLAGETA